MTNGKQVNISCPVDGCPSKIVINSTDSKQVILVKGQRFRKHLREFHSPAELACVIYRVLRLKVIEEA